MKKILALVVTLIVFGTSALALAQYKPVDPNSPDPNSSDYAQKITDRRKKALEACVAETGGGAGGGLFNAQGLSGTLSQGLTQVLPAASESIISNQFLSSFLDPQNGLSGILGQNFLGGVQNNFPEILGQIIRSSGQSDSQVRQNMPQFISQALGQITPSLTSQGLSQVQNDLPSLLEPLLGTMFNQHLAGQLQPQIPNILQLGQFAPQLRAFLQSVAGNNPLTNWAIDLVFNNLLGGVSQTINGDLTGESLAPVSQELGAQYANPIGGLLNGGQLSVQIATPFSGAINGSVGQISGSLLSPITNAFSGVTNIAGQPLDQLTHTLSNAISSPLSGLSGSLSSQISNAIGGSLGNFTHNLNLGGALGGIDFGGILGNSGLQNAINGLSGGLTGGVAGNVSSLIQQATGGTPLAGIPGLSDGFSGAIGGGGFGGSSFTAVPVHEVGDLLETTKNIDDTTTQIEQLQEEMKSLQIQICTELKVIHDIELLREEKEFKLDPDARKAAATAIEQSRAHMEQFLRTGRAESPSVNGNPNSTTSGAGDLSGANIDPLGLSSSLGLGTKNNGQPLIVQNPDQIRREIEVEETSKFIEQLQNSFSPFGSQLAQEAKQASTLKTYDVLKPPAGLQYDSKGNIKENPSDPLGTILLASMPNGNYWGQKIMAQDIRNQNIAVRQADAAAEAAAGGNFTGTRTCDGGYTSDGSCRHWRTTTPSSVVEGMMLKLLGAAYDQAISAGENTYDFITKLFTGSEKSVAELVPVRSSGGTNTNPPKEDPCPSPGPCKSGGYKPQTNSNFNNSGFNIGLGDIFSGSQNNSGGNGGGNNGGITIPDFELPNTSFPAATINSFSVVPQPDNTNKLVWSTENALFCTPMNDWSATTQPPVHPNDVLGENSSLVIHPASGISYSIRCYGLNLTSAPAEQSISIP